MSWQIKGQGLLIIAQSLNDILVLALACPTISVCVLTT